MVICNAIKNILKGYLLKNRLTSLTLIIKKGEETTEYKLSNKNDG